MQPHGHRTWPGPGGGGGVETNSRCTSLPQPELFSVFEEETGGRRPASLAEPSGPQERVLRHTVEHIVDDPRSVQILDVPVPQLRTNWWIPEDARHCEASIPGNAASQPG